jgi:enoyl-[acyl-carrier protein] reductase III
MMLEGKKALVTGGSGAIGRAIALALHHAGAEVAITYYRNRKGADDTLQAASGDHRRALAFRVNLEDRAAIDQLFCEIKQVWGQLDIFVSNAVSAPFRAALDLPLRHWDHVLNANLTAFFHCTQRSVELMAGRPGAVVAISSLGARRCAPGYAALGVAKAGIEALARYLAVELAERNINVNVVCPGTVQTPALNGFGRVVPDVHEYTQSLLEQTPDRKPVAPAEVAAVVTFLCSPEAQRIRGQTIVVDGGFSLRM